jgi:cell division septal protein FtsQ
MLSTEVARTARPSCWISRRPRSAHRTAGARRGLDERGGAEAAAERHSCPQAPLRYAKAELQEDFALRQTELRTKLVKQVEEVVQRIAKEKGIDVILSEGLVYFSDSVDISGEVIERLEAGVRQALIGQRPGWCRSHRAGSASS